MMNGLVLPAFIINWFVAKLLIFALQPTLYRRWWNTCACMCRRDAGIDRVSKKPDIPGWVLPGGNRDSAHKSVQLTSSLYIAFPQKT